MRSPPYGARIGGGSSAPAAAGSSNGSSGGPGPRDPLGPLTAVVLLRGLPVRFASLFARADREALFHCLPASTPRWSALECAVHVGDVLEAADVRLRRLLGEDVHPRAHVEAPRAGSNGDGCGAVLEALTVRANRLARTITSATGLDWESGRTNDGVSAPELVGRALKEAVHHLLELESALELSPAR